jgi:hypothetical protein
MRNALYPQRPSRAPCQTVPIIREYTHLETRLVFNDLLRLLPINYPPIPPI